MQGEPAAPGDTPRGRMIRTEPRKAAYGCRDADRPPCLWEANDGATASTPRPDLSDSVEPESNAAHVRHGRSLAKDFEFVGKEVMHMMRLAKLMATYWHLHLGASSSPSSAPSSLCCSRGSSSS